METLSAASSNGEECGMTVPFKWKTMFPRVRHFVLFSLALGTFKYSQERQAKKKVPMISCVVATFISVLSLRRGLYSDSWIVRYALYHLK